MVDPARSDALAEASAGALEPPALMASSMKLATCGPTRTTRVLPMIRPTLMVLPGTIGDRGAVVRVAVVERVVSRVLELLA